MSDERRCEGVELSRVAGFQRPFVLGIYEFCVAGDIVEPCCPGNGHPDRVGPHVSCPPGNSGNEGIANVGGVNVGSGGLFHR